MVTIRKKTAILLIAFTIAAFAVLGGFILQARGQTAGVNRYVQVSYRRAFSDLVTNMDGIDNSLQKSLYATSPAMTSSVCTEIFGKAMAAQSALSALPFASYELEHTSAFVAKVGDYAYALSRNASKGNGLTEEERSNLTALSENAAALAQDLRELFSKVDEGAVSIGEMEQAQDSMADKEDEDVSTDLAGSFRQIESDFGDIPSLIYDGPFSEHIAEKKPVMLEGLEDVDENQAIQAAAEAMDMEAERLQITSQRDTPFPVYVIGSKEEGSACSAEVSKAGGQVIFFEKRGTYEGQALSDEKAGEAAKTYLSEHGFDPVSTTYVSYNGNRVIVNCAYDQEGVICYPDLIKVTIAPDGTVTGMDCLGYVTNHTQRALPEKTVDETQAQKQVSSSLTVLSHQMAVIPTSGKNEVYCHEFKCENADGQHYIVYVNAESGLEENILILLEDENGTLTI